MRPNRSHGLCAVVMMISAKLPSPKFPSEELAPRSYFRMGILRGTTAVGILQPTNFFARRWPLVTAHHHVRSQTVELHTWKKEWIPQHALSWYCMLNCAILTLPLNFCHRTLFGTFAPSNRAKQAKSLVQIERWKGKNVTIFSGLNFAFLTAWSSY